MATSNFYTSLKNAEISNDTENMAIANMGLGLVIHNMNKWKNAIDYFEKTRAL